LHRDEKRLKNALAAPLRRRLAPRTAFTSKRGKTRMRADLRGRKRATPGVYNIDYSRCIFLRLCVEGLPDGRTFTHGHGFEARDLQQSNSLFTERTTPRKRNPPLRLRLHVKLAAELALNLD